MGVLCLLCHCVAESLGQRSVLEHAHSASMELCTWRLSWLITRDDWNHFRFGSITVSR